MEQTESKAAYSGPRGDTEAAFNIRFPVNANSSPICRSRAVRWWCVFVLTPMLMLLLSESATFNRVEGTFSETRFTIVWNSAKLSGTEQDAKNTSLKCFKYGDKTAGSLCKTCEH
jgi:hypothetical protein